MKLLKLRNKQRRKHLGNKLEYDQMKSTTRAYTTKRQCSVHHLCSAQLSFNARTLVMQDISIFLNSNLPKKRYTMFKKKAEVDELPGDIFQLNMLDR